MNERNSRDRRDLWLPGFVGLVGALIALAGWGLLIAERRDRILEATRETAAQTRVAVELDLEQQVSILRGLAELWTQFGRDSLPEWTAIARQQVARVAGLTSVAWVDRDDPGNRVVVGEEPSAEAVDRDARDARRHSDRPSVAGPEADASGAFSYRVLLPAATPEHRAGVLVARFRVEPLLRSVLRGRARGYALSVYWGEDEIFARGAASGDAWQQWWQVAEEIPLPLGGEWRVVHRPTADLAAARLTPVPHYLLCAGIVLAIVLGLVVHQLRVIVRQSRFLAASNRALEERGLELESKVADRTEALEDAVMELEAFNYSVSHDLRSPLGAILNFATILEEDYRDQPLDADAVAILGRIRRSAARATALLEDLLQLSRASRAALTFEPVDMTELAGETFAQVRAAEDDGEIEFLVDPLPAVTGDRTLLGDVFANLFSNALKYSRGCEKRRIRVTGRVDGDLCVYEVADNGHGFDMRFVDKVFELFERLHSAEEIEGTGVGLAMVVRIAKRHGGRVWAEARPGEGARFSFAIPRREAP